MSYSNGYITVPKTGVYYIYAQLWCDPQQTGDSKWCGFDITINSNSGVARTVAVKDKEDDHSMYAGVIRPLQNGSTISVVIVNKEYYEFTAIQSYFGAFMII